MMQAPLYSRTALKRTSFTCLPARAVRRAGKAVMARSHYNYIPPARGQFADGGGQSNFAEDSGRG